MKRLSSPSTFLWCRLVPAVMMLLVIWSIGGLLPDLLRQHAWGEMILMLTILGAGITVPLWQSAVYDVWLRGDELILRRGFSTIEIPSTAVSSVEVPFESLRLVPAAWLHWTDATGRRRQARFLISRSREWQEFRAMLGTRHRATRP